MPDSTIRKQIVAHARRVLVKIGTNAVCSDTGRPDRRAIGVFASQISKLMQNGLEVTLVASGAIGAGVGELNLPARPKSVPELQAAAAVGQGQLMRTFHDAFARRGVRVAQVLLTRDAFEDRTRYLNIRNTLRSLRNYGAVPIINENDTVAVDEIRFGENDILAALVAGMIGAQVVVFLTGVDGVIKKGQVLDVIEKVDAETHSLARPHRSTLGSGGMTSKLSAARIVGKAGNVAIIANARTPNVLLRLMKGERLGTLFLPAARKMSSRRRWIGQASRPAGKIIIDPGAARALTRRGKSLLPSGITAVSGKFKKGSTVAIYDASGAQIARGLTNYSSDQIEKIRGLKSSRIASVLGDKPYDEIVHRNNMTLD